MTINLALLTREVAICVTDRRLSAPTGGIVSERGNKLATFQCKDARGFFTYNGIGRDETGRSPNDWLVENPILPMLSFDEFVNTIKRDADGRLTRLSNMGFDTRHSFLIGGYTRGVAVLALVSNYESLCADGGKPTADAELTIEYHFPNPGPSVPILVLATGAIHPRKKPRLAKIAQLAKKGATHRQLRSAMIKLVRDVAYAADRRGTVGTSVSSAIVPLFGSMEVASDVVGGTTLLEGPNMIAPGMLVRDVYIDVSGKGFRSRYNPVNRKAFIMESRCAGCRSPVPEGYNRCGVCDRPVNA